MTIKESRASGVATAAQVLSKRLAGRVILAGTEGWELARQAWNLAVDQQRPPSSSQNRRRT